MFLLSITKRYTPVSSAKSRHFLILNTILRKLVNKDKVKKKLICPSQCLILEKTLDIFLCYTALNALPVKTATQQNKKNRSKTKIFMNDKSEENSINLYCEARVSSEKTR